MGHFYPRQAVLAPAGLITEPNEYGQYPPGALKLARNVTMREPGKLVQAPDVTNTVNLNPALMTNSPVMKLMPADSGVVYALVKNPERWYIFADGVDQTFVGSEFDAFSSTGRINWAQCNDRLLVNGSYGTLVHDPVPISTDFRAAGLPQISITQIALTGAAGWLEPGHAVQYRVCLVRKYGDDYTLRSAPSVPFRMNAGPNPFNTIVSVEFPADSGIEEGDVIELYRTDILATTSLYADTGGTYKLVQEYALTASDVAAPPPGGIALTDTQPPILGTLRTQGRELYTNPGVEGENYANLRPPIAQCLVSFKGFCFYGNTTERAQLTFGVPGGWGNLNSMDDVGIPAATARAKGIGIHQGAGTFTSGSAIITAVPDTTGVVVGQRWAGSSTFPTGTTVIAVSATTITMSEPVDPVIQDSEWTIVDVIEIDGDIYSMASPDELLAELNGQMEAQFDQAISERVAGYAAFKFTLMWNYHPFNRPIVVRATNGSHYSPPLPELGFGLDPAKTIYPLTRKNRLCWSKEQQPEHTPSVSETFVGFGEMYAMNVTRDKIWIWCSDGLHFLNGNGGSLGLGAWQVDYANATLLLCAPQASTVLDDRLYGYTNEGVVEIDSAGNRRDLTAGVIANLLPGLRYREMAGLILERNEQDGEVLLAPADAGDSLEVEDLLSQNIYIYNVAQRGWTMLTRGFLVEEAVLTTAIGMHRLPPGGAQPHVLFADYHESLWPTYSSWNAEDSFLATETQYQPLYGEDPLELKRWMWGDFLFGVDSAGFITVIWNSQSYNSVPTQLLDVGLYARAGVPRDGGLSHSICPGFEWASASFQSKFEGLSMAIKQRTNQSKQR